jgi:NAD(P)-dependent dehydrogenase (short-subunit alcohol dehydrogenase family)
VGAPYVAAKAGAAQLVRQAALELARYNITVNAIAPGPFVTNISGGRLRDPAVRAPFEKFSPMRRLCEPDDIKGLALFPGLSRGRVHHGGSNRDRWRHDTGHG